MGCPTWEEREHSQMGHITGERKSVRRDIMVGRRAESMGSNVWEERAWSNGTYCCREE